MIGSSSYREPAQIRSALVPQEQAAQIDEVGVTHASIDPVTRVVTLTWVPTHQYALTVTATGNRAGDVTSNPPGIACGPSAGTACSANFPAGTQVTLSSTAATASRFAGWGGACTGTGNCTVTTNAATTVTAQFVATIVVHVTITEPFSETCNQLGCATFAGAHVVFDGGSQPDCTNFSRQPSTTAVTCDYVVDRGRPSINIDARVEGGNNDISVVAVYSA